MDTLDTLWILEMKKCPVYYFNKIMTFPLSWTQGHLFFKIYYINI